LRRHSKARSVESTSGVGISRFGAALAACLFALLVVPGFASAAELPFLETFGSASQPSLSKPTGMAADQATGDLLVINLEETGEEKFAGSLHRYKPNGEPDPFSALGTNVIDGAGGEDATPAGEILSNLGFFFGPAETEVAVAPPGSAGGTAGDIYVTDGRGGVIDVFAPTGKFLGQKALAPESYPCGVAVDPTGNVFVGSRSGSEGVHKYTPTAPATFTESESSPFTAAGAACLVAAENGSVYGASFFATTSKLDSEGEGEGTFKYELEAPPASGLSVDPLSGHLFLSTFVFEEPFEIQEFEGSSGTPVSKTTVSSTADGVAADGTAGKLYVTREGSPNVEVFALGTPPELDLSASVAGNGAGTLKCKFDGGPAEACAGEHPGGTEVMVEATPAVGSEASLSGTGSAAGCSASPCSFSLREDSSVTAKFDLEPSTIGITSLSPDHGSTSGGNAVVLSGQNFTGAESVEFGTTPATSFTVNSATQIEATAPPHSPGTVDVHVKTPSGESVNLESDDYTFLAQPAVSAISPSKGPLAGGNQVVITGSEFTGAEEVKFGSTTASFTVESGTQIKATAPACPEGTVHVTVIGPGGASTTSPADEYTCQGVPTVSSISPSEGPLVGGITVTITGAHLEGAEEVKFGSTAVTITEDTATQIKATAPACSAGALHVTVTTPGGTSSTSAADEYTCVTAPTVTSVSPTKGPLGGGETVTITGTDLAEASAVHFGPEAATITEDTATQVKVTVPSCVAGALHITVTTAGGTSATGAGDEFTCVAAPTISSITPAKGADEGGNQIEISGLNLSAASKVEFGTTIVTPPFLSNSATKVKVKVPAHAAGKVDVRVTTVGGTPAAVAAAASTCRAPPDLTLGHPGSGSGSVSCDAGTCKASYVFGTKVALTATADAGSSFAGFSGGGCAGTSCTLILEEDTTVTATFTANPPSGGGGGASPAPAPAPTPIPAHKPFKCKKGFKKKTVHGKARCVKAKKHKRHRR
jgi:hypothetical protein